jgi:hypothetical protein
LETARSQDEHIDLKDQLPLFFGVRRFTPNGRSNRAKNRHCQSEVGVEAMIVD